MNAASIILLSVVFTNADSQNVLLYFTGEHCVHCRTMNPIVSRLQRQNAPIRKVDVQAEPALTRRLGIHDIGIPAYVLIVDGKVKDRVAGAISERRLQEIVSRVPRSAAPKREIARIPTNFRSGDTEVQLIGSSTKPKPRFSLPLLGRSLFEKKQNSKWAIESTHETNSGLPRDAVVRAKLGERKAASAKTPRPSPFASSVRIRIKDSEGISYGSGTVIQSRPGNTLILTCGHIFRDFSESNKGSIIEVDVFEGKQSETYVGKVIRYDLDADVGLMSIPTEGVIATAKIAGTGTQITQGNRVLSIGCSNGELPTRQTIQVTALNRYRGPDNIECTGVPIQGRSGGGLFNASGEVIGVCIAADPRDRRGLYAGQKAVHKLLDQAELSALYRGTEQRIAQASGSSVSAAQAMVEEYSQNNQLEKSSNRDWVVDREQMAEMLAGADREEKSDSQANDLIQQGRFNQLPELPASLKQGGEAEIICIIRPLNDPQAISRVVVINRASPKFVSYLQGELKSQPKATTKTVKYSHDVAHHSRRNRTVNRPVGTRRYRMSADLR